MTSRKTPTSRPDNRTNTVGCQGIVIQRRPGRIAETPGPRRDIRGWGCGFRLRVASTRGVPGGVLRPRRGLGVAPMARGWRNPGGGYQCHSGGRRRRSGRESARGSADGWTRRSAHGSTRKCGTRIGTKVGARVTTKVGAQVGAQVGTRVNARLDTRPAVGPTRVPARATRNPARQARHPDATAQRPPCDPRYPESTPPDRRFEPIRQPSATPTHPTGEYRCSGRPVTP